MTEQRVWPAGVQYHQQFSADPRATVEANATILGPGEIGLDAPGLMTTDEAEAIAHALLAAVTADRKENP